MRFSLILVDNSTAVIGTMIVDMDRMDGRIRSTASEHWKHWRHWKHWKLSCNCKRTSLITMVIIVMVIRSQDT